MDRDERKKRILEEGDYSALRRGGKNYSKDTVTGTGTEGKKGHKFRRFSAAWLAFIYRSIKKRVRTLGLNSIIRKCSRNEKGI